MSGFTGFEDLDHDDDDRKRRLEQARAEARAAEAAAIRSAAAGYAWLGPVAEECIADGLSLEAARERLRDHYFRHRVRQGFGLPAPAHERERAESEVEQVLRALTGLPRQEVQDRLSQPAAAPQRFVNASQTHARGD